MFVISNGFERPISIENPPFVREEADYRQIECAGRL
jgi:hypothetical protein